MTPRHAAPAVLAILLGACGTCPGGRAGGPPNIIFVMADDLGYGHLGCYGQEKIETPHIDRLAREGMRFTQFYAGAPVCAPSRSVLMTGLHGGHTPVRGNLGGQTLHPDDLTVAEVLGGAGYATGGFGKWGLGLEETPGHPLDQGFDTFVGCLHQVHGHFYYPYWLTRDRGRMMLPENEGGRRGRYAHDVMMEEAFRFIRKHRGRPFFCYLPVLIPHVEVVAPEASMKQYRGRWKETPGFQEKRPGYIVNPEPKAAFAAMVSHLDRSVGKLVDLVEELGLTRNTVLVFTSDNGAQSRYDVQEEFFGASGPLRGYKGSVFEGGLRVPAIVRWPGRVAAGATTGHVAHFADVLPTLAELAGVRPPATDGISFVPTLLGRPQERRHAFLYWELCNNEGRMFRRGARMGRWKAVQNRMNRPVELYDLAEDLAEADDLAARRPEVLAELEARMEGARTPARTYERGRRRTAADYVR